MITVGGTVMRTGRFWGIMLLAAAACFCLIAVGIRIVPGLIKNTAYEAEVKNESGKSGKTDGKSEGINDPIDIENRADTEEPENEENPGDGDDNSGSAANNSNDKINSDEGDDSATDNNENMEPDTMKDLEARADEILGSMTLREKIYQMCIITPEQLGDKSEADNEWSSWPVTKVDERAGASLAKRPVGGIIFFEDHLQSPEQTRKMLADLQDYAAENGQLPLFLCVDEEGGRVARIAKNAAFGVENVGPMKNVTSAEDAMEVGRTIGKYLSDLGFNVDFAPDADVLTAAGSVIIGDRSFGNDPQTVTELAAAVSDGLHEYGILSCFKHFPGHGAVEADTHAGLAYTDKTLAELLECEIIPFAKAQEKGVDMIMAAHISVPAILGDNTPCSLSKYLLTDILKDSLGYEGLVITDALNMGAITKMFDNKTAAVEAVKAGVDILLMPPDLEAAADAVEEAVRSGEIPEESIDAFVRKILFKKLGL